MTDREQALAALPRTVTLSDGSVWIYKPRWDDGQGCDPEPWHQDGYPMLRCYTPRLLKPESVLRTGLTASDHRAIADVLEPREAPPTPEWRVGNEDDELVFGDFHMERMNDQHIWFAVGGTSFDLVAEKGGRLRWNVQDPNGWDGIKKSFAEEAAPSPGLGTPDAWLVVEFGKYVSAVQLATPEEMPPLEGEELVPLFRAAAPRSTPEGR